MEKKNIGPAAQLNNASLPKRKNKEKRAASPACVGACSRVGGAHPCMQCTCTWYVCGGWLGSCVRASSPAGLTLFTCRARTTTHSPNNGAHVLLAPVAARANHRRSLDQQLPATASSPHCHHASYVLVVLVHARSCCRAASSLTGTSPTVHHRAHVITVSASTYTERRNPERVLVLDSRDHSICVFQAATGWS